MELIKDVMRQFYPVLIMTSCLLLVLSIFFSASGAWGKSGNIFSFALETRKIQNECFDYIEESMEDFFLDVRYIGGVKSVGEIVCVQELFAMENQEAYEIYLVNIKQENGDPAMVILSAEDIAAMEVIPAPIIYEKESDMLYFCSSGLFTMSIKVYGTNGSQRSYDFKMPVELG